MIYGKPRIKTVNDTTDLIGIRTLVLSQMWQPSRGDLTQDQLDKEQPAVPTVSGGVLLVGEQTRMSGGAMQTFWTFQGIKGDGKSVTFKDRTNSPDYGFEPGFSQASIQRHPKFQKLIKTYGGFPDNDGGRVIWPPTYNPGGNSALSGSKDQTNPMFGVNDFFQMEGTYRFRYASLTLPGDILTSAGTIHKGNLPGRPPSLPEGRNWLMLPTLYRHRGTIYDITEQYWMSGRGGWPVPVYGSASDSDKNSLFDNRPLTYNIPGLGTVQT